MHFSDPISYHIFLIVNGLNIDKVLSERLGTNEKYKCISCFLKEIQRDKS